MTGRRTRTRVATVAAVMAVILGWSALPAAAAPAYAPERVEVTAADGDDGDAFGSAVDVDGDTMVAAAVCDETAGGNCDGSAYVFIRSDAGWVQQAKLVPSDIRPFDEFGQSVSVDGNTVVVGAWNDVVPGQGTSGSAYVFVRSGSTWTEQAKLIAPDGAPFDAFGGSVAVRGNTAVVGASADTVGPVSDRIYGAGSAYVFARSGSTWTFQTKLLAPDRAGNDFFGNALALDGNTVLVGAVGDDGPQGSNAGSAYVFLRSGTSWQPQAKLTALDAGAKANFGTSVALDGRTALVGDRSSLRPASAYVFVRSGTTWAQQAVLNASDAMAGAFGWAVDVSGNVAVVGAYATDSGGYWTGSAYVYTRSGTTWTQRARLTPPDPVTEREQFGQAVAADTGTIAIGALGHGVAGSVFVYQI